MAHQHELLYEVSGFRVTGDDEGNIIFQTVGTVGLSADQVTVLVSVLAAWIAA